LAKKRSKLNYRFRNAREIDVTGIGDEIKKASLSGIYNFGDLSQLAGFIDSLKFITEIQKGNLQLAIPGPSMADCLYVMEDINAKNAVGYVLVTGRSQTDSFPSYIEIRAFGINNKLQKRGLGKLMMEFLLTSFDSHILVAHCLPFATGMASLLQRNGFVFMDSTEGGKRTYIRN
jgi:ribosomal protein S18 acetylase RimI-like enzyme